MKRLNKVGWIVFSLLLFVAGGAQANYVHGIKLEDKIQLGGQTLVLNGAGTRSKFIVDVYVVGLYLDKKIQSEQEVFADKGPKRVALTMLRDVKSDLFYNGLNASILANHDEAEMKTLDKKVDALMKIIQAIPELKKDGTINLDYYPGVGTRVVINGDNKGTIEGEDFSHALLKIWIGKKPVNRLLKRVLLGEEDPQ